MPYLSHWRREAVTAAAVVLWIPAVAFGLGILWRYANTPGRPAAHSADWPPGAPVQPVRGQGALVMFAHPNCPCSRASIGELAVIMTRSQEKLDAHVFFHLPADEESAWARTDLWRSASAIPGVHVIEDRAGVFAERFGAFTSGQTLLYDQAGRLVFKGGITALRGHSGDNAGRAAIIALVGGANPRRSVTPVFGCSLRGDKAW